MTIAQAVKKFDIGRAYLCKLCGQGFVPGAVKVEDNGVFRWEIPNNIIITKVPRKTSFGYEFRLPPVIVDAPPCDMQKIDAYVWLHQNDKTNLQIRKKFCCSHQDVQDALNRGIDRLKRGIDPSLGVG